MLNPEGKTHVYSSERRETVPETPQTGEANEAGGGENIKKGKNAFYMGPV